MRLGLFGLPGAGKGTQAARMAAHWSIPHISTGDMFREIQKGDSPFAKEIRGILAQGALVPDEMVTKLAFDRLAEKDCEDGFILDGFPRTLSQAKALQGSRFALDALLSIDVERSEIIKRLSSRRVCEHCQSVFSGDTAKTACPKDGHPLAQRADDRPEAVAKRLDIFKENFSPVMNFYQGEGRLHTVNGGGSPDVVFERIVALIEEISGEFDGCN